jgi:hypothetical protein
MIRYAGPASIRAALEAAAEGKGGSMLEATAAMSVEEAEQFATRWILEHDVAGVRVYRKGPWLHIEPDVPS